MIGNPSAIHPTTFFDHLANMAEAILIAAIADSQITERKKVGRPFFTYRSTRRNTFFRGPTKRPAGMTWAKFNAAVRRR